MKTTASRRPVQLDAIDSILNKTARVRFFVEVLWRIHGEGIEDPEGELLGWGFGMLVDEFRDLNEETGKL